MVTSKGEPIFTHVNIHGLRWQFMAPSSSRARNSAMKRAERWSLKILPSPNTSLSTLRLKLNGQRFTATFFHAFYQRNFFYIYIYIYIPPLQRSWKGGILVSPCPSVRRSVDKIVSALYLQQYSLDPFHICTSYQATKEGVSRVMPVSKFKNCNFGEFFKFVTLTLSSFELGSNMTHWYG